LTPSANAGQNPQFAEPVRGEKLEIGLGQRRSEVVAYTPMTARRLFDVTFDTHTDQTLRVTSLREQLDDSELDVTHLVAPDLRFTCLTHLRRFLETSTGHEVTLCAL
jgi:hypothetical protein